MRVRILNFFDLSITFQGVVIMNYRAKNHCLLALTISVFSSCGSTEKKANSEETSHEINKSKYLTVSSTDLSYEATSVKGSGSIVFENPLESIKSGSHFDLESALEDGGSVTLIAFSSNKLENGVALSFSRSGEKLSVKLEAEGKTEDLSTKFADQKASSISFAIDIHNDEAPAHVLIWPGAETGFGEDAALFNSEDGPAAPGNGTATFWGLTLSKATVTKAENSEPRFEE
jgi:hypothetical protein